MADVLWVGYPRSWTPGRRMRIMGVCLHYTAGSEGPTSAEAGARYDKTRPDGTSTHLFTDSLGPALREVPDGDRAHTARAHGNEIFIHIEICGTVQTRAQWLDAVSLATLRTTAAVVAELVRKHDLQVRRMTDAEVRAAYFSNSNPSAVRGICDHANCTRAFPEDDGSHLDVGTAFPWDVFLTMVHEQIGGQDMPKIMLVEDGPNGRGLYAGGGSGWWNLAPDEVAKFAARWGIAVPADWEKFEHTHYGPMCAEFGPYLGTSQALAVPAGPPGRDGADGEPGADGQGFAPGQTVTLTGTVAVSG